MRSKGRGMGLSMAYDVDEIRKDFPILKRKIYGKRLVYFDNAATSQKPRQVIDAVKYYYENYNANPLRGLYKIAEEATTAYVHSKELVSKFINSDKYRSIIYCRNTTEGINIVARTWAEEHMKKGDHVLITKLEHHSNIVPWMMLSKRKGVIIDYASLKDNKYVDMEDFKAQLEKGPKLVSFAHVSNVLGTINDAKEMTRLAHRKGAKVLIDGAQSVPHMKIDVKDIDCDFLAFSSHKMLGPSGVGVLYGKEELLENMEPMLGGGEMIRSVDFEKATWNELPWKFEAGTQNIEGAIGLGVAVEYLNKVGMGNIREHEKKITKYALGALKDKGVITYGPGKEDIEKRGGVIAFKIKGAHAHDVAQIFDSEGITIRSGHHCAMPLVTKLLDEQAVARMSFYLYNKEEEVDIAINAVDKVRKVLKISA